jgi:hypothetical protein
MKTESKTMESKTSMEFKTMESKASALDEPKTESKTALEFKAPMDSKASALDGPDLKRHYNDNIKSHKKFVYPHN